MGSQSLLRKCWSCVFVANFVEALVEKCLIRQRLRQRLPTKFSAPLTFATAFSQRWCHFHIRGLVVFTASFVPALLRQCLVQFALVKELFFRVERPGADHPNLFPIRPIHAEHSYPAGRTAQVEEPG